LPEFHCNKRQIDKTLFSLNVGALSSLRAHSHLMWVHYRLMWVRPVSCSHLLWAQINHYCGSGCLSLRTRYSYPVSGIEILSCIGLRESQRWYTKDLQLYIFCIEYCFLLPC
jgi:hypothetical protein